MTTIGTKKVWHKSWPRHPAEKGRIVTGCSSMDFFLNYPKSLENLCLIKRKAFLQNVI